MAGFGGAVKLTGESEYRKALAKITQELKVVGSEMKATASAFQSGDKSITDVASESEKLSKALDSQKNSLAGLKSQLSQMQTAYDKMGDDHKELLDRYTDEKKKLEEIGRTLGTSSKEYQDQKTVVENLSKEVTDSTRAYDAQGKALNDMKIKTANAETVCNNTAKALNDLGNEAIESGKNAEKGSDGFTVYKAVLADLASTAIKNALNGLKQLGGAMVDVGKQAVSGYAEMEQLEGGVKKIFGDDMASTVIENANNAFKTAGMNANEYMDTVTSFSSSLIQSLNGDTKTATGVADRAIQDMADNANTFGTDIKSIQNAYQGFAKQNFTMLDNLKLGRNYNTIAEYKLGKIGET